MFGNIEVEKFLVSSKISFRVKNFKYFIGYLYHGNNVKPLNVMLPKTTNKRLCKKLGWTN